MVLGKLVVALQGKIEYLLGLHAVFLSAFVQDKAMLGFHISPIVYGPQGGT